METRDSDLFPCCFVHLSIYSFCGLCICQSFSGSRRIQQFTMLKDLESYEAFDNKLQQLTEDWRAN